MKNNKNKTDPLLNMTDDELYSMRSHEGCPERELWDAERDLLESIAMPLCCRGEARCFQKSTTDVARVLNSAGIACVLWDAALHRLYGLPLSTSNVEFIVADDLVDKAAETLCKNLPPVFGNVTRCPSNDQCEYAAWNCAHWNVQYNLPHRGPQLHLHTEMRINKYRSVVIRLFKQSMTLWAMPSLTEMPVPDNGSQANVGKLALSLAPNYTLATHPRFVKFQTLRQQVNDEGPGRYPADLHPVVVPTPECAMEAMLRRYARYSCTSEFSKIHQWMFHLERPILEFFSEIKRHNSGLLDVRRMTPIIGFLVQVVLKGDITRHQLRVVLREALGEPAYHDKSYRESYFLLDDCMLNEFSAWYLDHDDPEYLMKAGLCPTFSKLPEKKKDKKERKYWLQIRKKD